MEESVTVKQLETAIGVVVVEYVTSHVSLQC
jgi:hypothetical protein